RAIRAAVSTSKPTTRSGTCGSASTYGAPPSGSPAQTSSRAWASTCRGDPKVAARIIASVSARGLARDNIVGRAQSRPRRLTSVGHCVQHDVDAHRVARGGEALEGLMILALSFPGG